MQGITPAYAGKTKRRQSLTQSKQDHPRSRGKDGNLRINQMEDLGAPPLTRERLSACISVTLFVRITPAGAGKTFQLRRRKILAWEHPRLRGKDKFNNNPLELLEGSPPLTRERRSVAPVKSSLSRITPAYAGKTICLRRPIAVLWDHPRLRGKD